MKALLDKKEAAHLLGISLRSLDYYRTRENLPYHIIGGKLVRFSEDEIEQWAIGRDGKSSKQNKGRKAD